MKRLDQVIFEQASRRGAFLPIAAIMIIATAPPARGQISDSIPRESTPQGLAREPAVVTEAINWLDDKASQRDGSRSGFYPELGNMISGSGWISGGPGYRQSLLGSRAVLSASAAVSWRLYTMSQVQFDAPSVASDRVSVGSQVMFQDMLQINYFGVGSDSLRSNRSGYRLRYADMIGYASIRAAHSVSINSRFGYLHHPHVSAMAGRDVAYPNTLEVFNDTDAPRLNRQPSFAHGDISLVIDTRDSGGHATRGGMYRTTAAAYSDRDEGMASFRRYEVEGSQFIPIVPNWVIAVHGFATFTSGAAGTVPFYLLPSLGGKNTLRGYDDFRFHDRDAEVFSAESRWSLWAHMDAAIFADSGKVGGRPGDLAFHQMKTSYGAGLRVHNHLSILGRAEVAHSEEGWRVLLTVTDPFTRSTLSGGRTVVAPYAP